LDLVLTGQFADVSGGIFEAKTEIPVTQVNNDFIGNDFGMSYHINTGVRILLWDIY
jgi:hypothetical protein